MPRALDTQVGGTHYKGMAIEPFTFALANDYDAANFSILKYVSRHRLKSGAACLQKAEHIAFIRASERPDDSGISARDRIPIETYISENGIPEMEAEILRENHRWARNEMASLTDLQIADWIAQKIAHLRETVYGETT